MNLTEIKNFKKDINTITEILIGGSINENQYNSKCESTIKAYSITYNIEKSVLKQLLKK